MDLFSYKLGKKAGGGGGDTPDLSEYFYTTIDHNTDTDNNYGNPVKKLPQFTLNENVDDLSYCFYGSVAKYIDVSKMDTTNVSTFNYMFRECSNLEEIDVSNFNSSSVTNVTGMFNNCVNIKKINMANFDIPLSSSKSSYLFAYCKKLAVLDISSFTSAGSSNAFLNVGIECLQSDGAYADGIPYIYVKNASVQSTVISRNSNWSTANVIIKGE